MRFSYIKSYFHIQYCQLNLFSKPYNVSIYKSVRNHDLEVKLRTCQHVGNLFRK